MIKYASIINEKTGLCSVGTGTNSDFYRSIGMQQLDVKQSDIDGAWYISDKCPMKTDEEKAQEERERLDMLFLTGSDVERAIYKVKDMDFDDILAMVKNNPDIDAKALKIEFKANNFYRGNPYISQVGALLGFTSEQMDRFFDTKDWHYLTNCNIKVTLQADEKPETEPVITINGVETKETTLSYGSTCTIKVECEGYKTLQPEDFTVTEDMHIELQLVKEEQAVDEENSETGDNK